MSDQRRVEVMVSFRCTVDDIAAAPALAEALVGQLRDDWEGGSIGSSLKVSEVFQSKRGIRIVNAWEP